MISSITEASEKRPITVVAIVAVITIGMLYGATNITMTSDTEDFLPQDYTSVKVTNILENKIGGTTREIVLIEGDNLASGKNFRKTLKLREEIGAEFEKYVTRIRSYHDYLISRLENRAKTKGSDSWRELDNQQLGENIDFLLSIPQIRRQTNSSLTENEDAILITITVNTELSDGKIRNRTKDLIDYIHEMSRTEEDYKAGITGMTRMEIETQNLMNRDNRVLIPTAIIVVVLILYLAFRKITDTIFPFLVLGLGSLWMVGSMRFLGIPFSMIYVALVPIILGIGIDYTIHMLNRYYEERGKGLGAKKSVTRSVRTIGAAIALTALTTIIGFSSFGTSDMPPIRNFGFLAGGGVLFIFILATTLLPSLLTLRDRSEEPSGSKGGYGKKDRIGTGLSKLESGVQKQKKPILIGAVIISLLCIIPAAGITTTMNFDTFLPKDVESVETMEKVEKHFGGSQRAFVLVRGDVLQPESLDAIRNLEDSVISAESSKGLIDNSNSLTGLILYAANSIPDSKEKVKTTIGRLRENHPEQVNRLLISKEKTIVYFTVSGNTDKKMEKATEIIRKEIGDISEKNAENIKFTLGGKPAVGGQPAIITDVMESIMPSMKQSIILAIILVGVVLAVVFRSALLGIIGALPISLALVWEFGALGIMGWPLDVMNMMVSALAIGIGVDFSIHIIHRFEEEWSKNGNSPEKSIAITIKSVGRAISSAAATTIGVFIVLSFSRMPPIIRFGQLSAMVIFFSLIGSLVVLPSVLLTYAKWKES